MKKAQEKMFSFFSKLKTKKGGFFGSISKKDEDEEHNITNTVHQVDVHQQQNVVNQNNSQQEQNKQEQQNKRSSTNPPQADLVGLFEKYKGIGIENGADEALDAIQGMGLMAFAQDMQVSPQDIIMLVLLWKFGCKNEQQYQIFRDQFVAGWKKLGCENLSQICNKLPSIRAELSNENNYKQFYSFVFDYLKQPGQRSLAVEIAVPSLKMLMTDKYPNTEQFCIFLATEYKKSLSKDTWLQFYDFTKSIKPDFSNYEDDGAWPVVLDEFVEYMRIEKK